MLDHANRERRLIGDNNGDEASGGALPLPEAFTAVLQYLYSHGTETFPDLVRVVRDKVSYKDKRILAVYNTWEEFTDDIVSQLMYKNLAEPVGDWASGVSAEDYDWAVTGEVKTGVSYPVITAEGRGTISVIIFSHDEQQRRNAAVRLAMDTSALRARFTEAELLTPQREEAFQRILDGLSMPAPNRRRRRREAGHPRSYTKKPKTLATGLNRGLASFYREWVKTAGWHRISDAATAWSEEYPARPPLDGDHQGSMRKAARDMFTEGLLERRSYKDRDPATGTVITGWEYRWVP